MPSRAQALTVEQFAAGLGVEEPVAAQPAQEFSPEDFAAGIEDVYPETPGLFGSLAGTVLEGMAAGPELAALSVRRQPGAQAVQESFAASPYAKGFSPQPSPPAPSVGFLEDWAGGLRGSAQAIYPEETRGRGGVKEQIGTTVGSTAAALPAMALGPGAAAFQFGAQESVPLYYDVLAATGDEEAATWALLGGHGLGQLEKFGVEGLLSGAVKRLARTGASKALLKEMTQRALGIGGAIVGETGTELAQTGGSDLILEALTDEDVDNLGRMVEVMPQAALMSLGVGTLVDVVEQGMARRAAGARQGPSGRPSPPATPSPESANPAAPATVLEAPQAAQEAPGARQAPDGPGAAQAPQPSPGAAEASPGRSGVYAHTPEPAQNSSVQPGDQLSEVEEVEIDSLREFNPKKRPEEWKVQEIQAVMERGEPLPPVIASRPAEGPGLVIDDGSHRIEAARRLGYAKVPVRTVGPAQEVSTSAPAAKASAPNPSQAPATVVEMMAGPPNPLGTQKPLSISKLMGQLRRWFTSEGDVPRGARRELELSSGFQRAEIVEAAKTSRALDKAMRAAHGAKWRGTPAAKQVDAAFEGDAAALAALPEPAQAAVADMRAHLDRLIRLQVKEGGVVDPKKQPEFAKKILESQGTYARRSYRAHMDPDWADKVPADVRQRAADLFRSMPEYAGTSDADITAEIDAILQEAKESADNPFQHLASGKLGRKDLSIYKRRKDVPAELRALLGEVEDPLANYANSVVKIASVVARHDAYAKIKEQGLGKWLHEKPTGKHTAKLASEGNRSLGPLDGLYTTPEVKKALREVSPEDTHWLMRLSMRANAAIKWGKVIGQPSGFMRNLQSNFPMLVANGHLPGFYRSAEWKAALGRGGLDELKRLTRLGIVGQGISTTEWTDLRASLKKTPEELVAATKSPKDVVTGAAERAYEGADNVAKIRFFYAEEAYLRKAGYTEKRAEEIASERTRDLMPTPERMAPALKSFRRQPLLGAFFSFKAEVLRNMGHRLALIAQEIKSPNSVERSMGFRRAAGLLAAASAAPALATAFNALNGIDAEEDRDRKEFVPEWDRDGYLVWFGDETSGKYLDLSDVDPFALFTKPLAAVLAGEDPLDALDLWARNELDAFFGLSPIAVLGVEMKTGKKESGAPIDDMVEHVIKSVQPGIVAAARKGVGETAVSATTGVRRYDFDVEASLGFDVRRFGAEISETTKAMNRQTKKSPGEAAEFKAAAEKERQTLFEELSRKTQAAIRLGVPTSRVRKMLDDSLSREVTNAILLGQYIPHKPKE